MIPKYVYVTVDQKDKCTFDDSSAESRAKFSECIMFKLREVGEKFDNIVTAITKQQVLTAKSKDLN